MGGRRGSNPRPPGPQPGALPLSYIHHLAMLDVNYLRAIAFLIYRNLLWFSLF